jgi:AbrB family looped-hinge helix DNA binding protein
MVISNITVKGQFLIPALLRRKYGILPKDRLSIEDRNGEIVIRPLPRDPVALAQGFLKGGPSLSKELLRERKKDRERENR